MNNKPWEIEPELTKDRLCLLAETIKQVRDKTVSMYDPDEGDGPWSLGCRIYERTINKIERKAEALRWLKIYREKLFFIIIINGVPLRFYKGKVDAPTLRTLRQRKFPELRNEQLMFDFESQREWVWRIAVDTDIDGSVLRASVAQYDKIGNHRNEWEIPITDPVTVVSPVEQVQHEAVELDKPRIHKKHKNMPGESQNVKAG